MIDYVINIQINQKSIYFLIKKNGPWFETAENSRLVEGLSTSYTDVRHSAHLMSAYRAHRVGESFCVTFSPLHFYMQARELKFPCLSIPWYTLSHFENGFDIITLVVTCPPAFQPCFFEVMCTFSRELTKACAFQSGLTYKICSDIASILQVG